MENIWIEFPDTGFLIRIKPNFKLRLSKIRLGSRAKFRNREARQNGSGKNWSLRQDSGSHLS